MSLRKYRRLSRVAGIKWVTRSCGKMPKPYPADAAVHEKRSSSPENSAWPRRLDWLQYAHVLLHGVRNGSFSMRCYWATVRGQDRAARFILEKRVEPLDMSGDARMPGASGT